MVGKGVPQSLFGLYEAANELRLLEVPGSGSLVRFGSCGSSGSTCLEPSTGHIVHDIGVPTIRPRVVNASLDQFTASVRAVLDRFPFDSEGSGEDQEDHEHEEQEDEWAYEDGVAERLENERTQAGYDLIERLRRIDPAAVADLDGFWHMFVADVQMGIYSIREMLNPPDS